MAHSLTPTELVPELEYVQALATVDGTVLDKANAFLNVMRVKSKVVKLLTPTEFVEKCDTLVTTAETLQTIPMEQLRYNIGRILIVVGEVDSVLFQETIDPFYHVYAKKIGYMVYSRKRPSLEI